MANDTQTYWTIREITYRKSSIAPLIGLQARDEKGQVVRGFKNYVIPASSLDMAKKDYGITNLSELPSISMEEYLRPKRTAFLRFLRSLRTAHTAH